MKKQQYIRPTVRVFSIQACSIICTSETNLRWSGNNAGSAGPNEIDEYSTYDAY